MSGSALNSYPEMDFSKVEHHLPDEEYEEVDVAHPAVNFKCYEFHTNFDIAEDIGLAIEYTPGVEFIKVLSPYRAFIGIGKFFDDREVQEEVKSRVSATFRGEDIISIIERLEQNNEED